MPTDDVGLTSRIEAVDGALSQQRQYFVADNEGAQDDEQLTEGRGADPDDPILIGDGRGILSVGQRLERLDSRQSPEGGPLGDGGRI